MDRAALETYRNEVIAELKNNILPFWMKNMIDYSAGNFYGAMNGAGVIDRSADKSVIMATRMLWTFSRAYIKLKDPVYLKTADLMFKYITGNFVDLEHGGVFWLLSHDGKPLDRTKKLYGQGFALFALAEYAKASVDKKTLAAAKSLFRLIEKYGRDRMSGGYIDALAVDWTPVGDMRLSPKEMNAPKSMNTNLHVMEALSVFAAYSRDNQAIEALDGIVKSFIGHIIQPDKHFGLFFDMNWKSLSGIISYGHDIEGSWLLTEAAHITGSKDTVKLAGTAAMEMTGEILKHGIDADGGLFNEGDAGGPRKLGKEWWMQAEGMVGFLNAYQLTGSEAYLERSLAMWEFCKKYFIRPEGEWYFYLNTGGKPDMKHELAGQWKCPYHNGRACMEVYERLGVILSET